MMKFLIKYYVRKELLNLKGSKLGQILRTDKTGFRRLGHIYGYNLPQECPNGSLFSSSDSMMYAYAA